MADTRRPAAGANAHMIDKLLRKHLEPIAIEHRRWHLYRGLARCWAAAALVGIVLALARVFTGWVSPLVFPGFVVVTVAATAVVWRRNRLDRFDYRAMARQIESEDPELHALLLTAVQQQPDATGELNYLQQRVITDALEWKRRHLWDQHAGEGVFFALCRQWAALVLLLGVVANLWLNHPAPGQAGVHRGERGVVVTPGDASIERGSSLVVLARFEGKVPLEVTLVIKPDNAPERRVPLVKNLNDPEFGGSVADVKERLTYRVDYSGESTRDFRVSVFDVPELQHADAQIRFPAYTGLPDKTIVNTRRVTAVEGSSLNYTFVLNKPVVSATLIAPDKSTIPLPRDTVRSNVHSAAFTLDESRKYELLLVDDAGRTNKLPPQFVIDVLKNRTPEIKLVAPGDQRVSPLEEVRFKADVSDDFGLRAYGIAYSLAGDEAKYVELGRNAVAHEKQQLDYLLSLEELAARPDQLVSYYVWADDAGPDGEIRRTSGDMYFAEVRPFDEIFREGQQPEGGGGGGGNESESSKLTELQKQIITATWNLQRREVASRPSAKYQPDAKVVQQSQDEALSKAQGLQEGVDDPRSRELINSVVREMEKAATQLADAAGNNSLKPLPTALSAEQAAYQSLLRLQAREYQVSRGNSRGGGGGGQRAQRQIDQLDLKTSENRYETQREASAQQQPPEQREQLQVLNRLKELAQRQQDLNERLKELQTALQEAQTEEEREEVRRRLKRLREEEQELMAGIDELNQRMSRPENQSRMAEARQQLEQTRSEVQRAAESLKDGSVSQALASGTRAQRDLQKLSDDMRRKSSSQFAEDMRRMRDEARELAQKQEELQRRLDMPQTAERKSLRDSSTDERQEIASGFEKQREKIDQLIEHAGQVSQQAENVEPLLSRQLYDTLRKTSQQDAQNLQQTTEELLRTGRLVRPVYERLQNGKSGSKRAVMVTSELLRDGYASEASQLAERAGKSIDELRQDVERAAASVLGDDTDALRQAARELDELTRQLENEIARADSASRTNSSAGTAATSPTGQEGEGNRQAGSSAQADSGSTNAPAATLASSSGDQSPQSGSQSQGQRPGEQSGQANASSGQPGESGQPGQSGQSGQQGNASQPGSSPGGQQTAGAGSTSRGQANSPNTSQGRQARAGSGGNRGGIDLASALDAGGGDAGGGGGGGFGPITGADYAQWSDRLRDVEEMIELQDLRAEVARVRDRARLYRQEFKRAGEKPSWAKVKLEISGPLVEVRSQIAEELARRQSNEAQVPADRDPVPAKFAELVRRYYEKLGKSE